ncbi:MAG: YqjF family protein [Gemmatimonadota bacterium]
MRRSGKAAGRSILSQTDHRPYPLPRGPWIMAQRWHDLLFAHWEIPPRALGRTIPAPLELDLFEGSAWIGIIPFTMSGVRLRGTPSLPGLSAFPELNVRTYVRYGDLAGVYFFSLDAGNAWAVAAARRWYRLPYFRARMEVHRQGQEIVYRSHRTHRGAAPAALKVRYRPTGKASLPAPTSLDRWLVERYRLLTVSEGRVLAAEIHHPPWRLCPAGVEFRVNTMTEGLNIELPASEPRLAFAGHQDVIVWAPREAESALDA